MCILEHIGSFHSLVFGAAGAVQLEKDALCSYLLLLSIIGVFFHNLHTASLSYFLTQGATECIFVYPSPFSYLSSVFPVCREDMQDALKHCFFFSLVQTSAGFWAVSTRKFRIDLFHCNHTFALSPVCLPTVASLCCNVVRKTSTSRVSLLLQFFFFFFFFSISEV